MACEDYEPEDMELATAVADGSLDRLANHLAAFITSDRASHCAQRLLPCTVRRSLAVLLVAAARSLAPRPVALR